MKFKVVGFNDEIDGKYKRKSSAHSIDSLSVENESERCGVSLFQLLKFSTIVDKLMMIVGTLAALGNGAVLPMIVLYFFGCIDDFAYENRNCNYSNATRLNSTSVKVSISSSVRQGVIILSVLGAASLVLGYLQVCFWLIPAERQIKKIRIKMFSSIVKQEINWFDKNKTGELTSYLSEDINKIKDGINDKVGNALQYFSTFLCGIVISFIKGWKLTLVALAIAPVLLLATVVYSKVLAVFTSRESVAYTTAGSIAQEVFTAIRTVFAFNAAKIEHKRYTSELENARECGIKKSALSGLVFGFLWMAVYSGYALCFWYGWKLTTEMNGEYTVGAILIVLYSIMNSIFSLGGVAPYLTSLATAKVAASKAFHIIQREPGITSTTGESNIKITGDVKFKNVNFKYPTRSKVKVLKGLSLHVQAGETVALVGSSGGGKSTCIQLLQRFYDPRTGHILIDDRDLREFNLNWWRSQIGVVNQEPVLFQTTITKNIRMGKEDATKEEVEAAAKNANAHDFIMSLPDKYETIVGHRGSHLSGGQKQRICIARALIKNPKIVLLDEATSALDNESEAIVQASLSRLCKNRTTIIIAHRLSTIRNADAIHVVHNGKIVESGKHDELIDKGGHYYKMVKAQNSDFDFKNQGDGKCHEGEDNATRVMYSELSERNEKKQETEKTSMIKLLALNKPEWHYILFGCIVSLINGAIQPAIGIVVATITTVLTECDIKKQKEAVILYCGLFVVFGVALFLCHLLQGIMFGISGENLTKRLRSKGFQSMLSQDVSWFDAPTSSVGALCTRLSTETSAVQGATGVRIGYFLMCIGNLGFGMTMALIYGWPLALVNLGFLPFVIMGGTLKMKLLTGFSKKDKKLLETTAQVANEAISNIRTVSSLSVHNKFIADYVESVKTPFRASLKSANVYGVIFGMTNSIICFSYVAVIGFGAYLIDKQLYGMYFGNTVIVISIFSYSGQAAGLAMSFLPDLAKARAAASALFELFERRPAINNWESECKTRILRDEALSTGFDICFDAVQFYYPNRPSVNVLKNFELRVNSGETVALVGTSGCGKSTVTQLLTRFYDPNNGKITLSNTNIRDLDTHWLRSQIAIVSQEPILFDTTIADNITYGCDHVDRSMVIEAAKQANIHSFIASLPKGYETNVGANGVQLSGGQKQRVAIARALIKNPRILILDEATSSLDNESEKIVEDALQKAQCGRTCIKIAHRLSTIKNSDLIHVMEDGSIKESGSHHELLEKNGLYANLYQKSFM